MVIADINIKPSGTLAETARILGEALAGLVFSEDSIGKYEEYPAYIAKREGVVFVLLGVPAPGDDLSDFPSEDFSLVVDSINDSGEEAKDISDDLLILLKADGRLDCWR